MKNTKIAEIAARYGTARAFERLLERVGWMKDGEWSTEPIARGFMTDGLEVTPLGMGYLYEASRERSR